MTTKTTRKQLERAFEAAHEAFVAAGDAFCADPKNMDKYRASIVAGGVRDDAWRAIGAFDEARKEPSRRNEFGEWTRGRE